MKAVQLCIIREALAQVSAQAARNFIIQGLVAYPIALGGTSEQKTQYLPPIANGEAIAAFALSEPGGGSDVVAMKTTATLEDDEWVLNGEKKYISQTGEASTYVVFAKNSPKAGSRSISAFIVE